MSAGAHPYRTLPVVQWAEPYPGEHRAHVGDWYVTLVEHKPLGPLWWIYWTTYAPHPHGHVLRDCGKWSGISVVEARERVVGLVRR